LVTKRTLSGEEGKTERELLLLFQPKRKGTSIMNAYLYSPLPPKPFKNQISREEDYCSYNKIIKYPKMKPKQQLLLFPRAAPPALRARPPTLHSRRPRDIPGNGSRMELWKLASRPLTACRTATATAERSRPAALQAAERCHATRVFRPVPARALVLGLPQRLLLCLCSLDLVAEAERPGTFQDGIWQPGNTTRA